MNGSSKLDVGRKGEEMFLDGLAHRSIRESHSPSLFLSHSLRRLLPMLPESVIGGCSLPHLVLPEDVALQQSLLQRLHTAVVGHPLE